MKKLLFIFAFFGMVQAQTLWKLVNKNIVPYNSTYSLLFQNFSQFEDSLYLGKAGLVEGKLLLSDGGSTGYTTTIKPGFELLENNGASNTLTLPIINGTLIVNGGGQGLFIVDSIRIKGEEFHKIDTTSISITLGAHYTVLCINTSNITITLPALSSAYNAATKTGVIYNIKKNLNNASTITVDGNASETIDGDMTQVISAYKTNMVIQAHSTGWVIL